MKLHKRQGIRDYAVLLLFSSLFIVWCTFISANKFNLKISIIGYAIYYCLWGVWHHQRENSLTIEVFLEYFLFSILGAILVVGMM